MMMGRKVDSEFDSSEPPDNAPSVLRRLKTIYGFQVYKLFAKCLRLALVKVFDFRNSFELLWAREVFFQISLSSVLTQSFGPLEAR